MEDAQEQREGVAALLADYGLTIVAVSDGGAALDAVAGSSFDCFLLDCALPGLDGVALAKRLLAENKAHASQIVFISGRAEYADLGARYQDLHGTHSIPKPLDSDKIGIILNIIGYSAVAVVPDANTLGAIADEFVSAVTHGAGPRDGNRELAFRLDTTYETMLREFLATVKAFSQGSPRKRRGRLDSSECAIVASALHDAGSVALARGMVDLWRLLHVHECRFRRALYWREGTPSFRARAALYATWGTLSNYGTSVGRWLAWGIVVTALFSVPYMIAPYEVAAPNPNDPPIVVRLGLWNGLYTSLRLFTDQDFGAVDNMSPLHRVVAAIEAVFSVLYFAVGFTILLTTFPGSHEVRRPAPHPTAAPPPR
ncbi:MAG TPA: response regulator [Candidatus Binatia bacterium]|nr:response regulator [Candidatus Binatia bacterium]